MSSNATLTLSCEARSVVYSGREPGPCVLFFLRVFCCRKPLFQPNTTLPFTLRLSCEARSFFCQPHKISAVCAVFCLEVFRCWKRLFQNNTTLTLSCEARSVVYSSAQSGLSVLFSSPSFVCSLLFPAVYCALSYEDSESDPRNIQYVLIHAHHDHAFF